jgi:hypothetical protein
MTAGNHRKPQHAFAANSSSSPPPPTTLRYSSHATFGFDYCSALLAKYTVS